MQGGILKPVGRPEGGGGDTDTPAASVVIPVRNNAPGLVRCLQGLARQLMTLEVLVVDDGSWDDTVQVANEAGARVFQAGGRGAAAARNVGWNAARTPIVLFTDSDCIPCPGWARSLSDPIRDGRAIATKGTYRTSQQAATARFVQLEYEERYHRMARSPQIDFLDTYSLGVRKEDLEAIGGFDEALLGASVEDQEMSFRLCSRGCFLFVPEAVVSHQHASTPQSYLSKKWRIGRGKATILRRHFRRIHGDSHTPTSLRLQVLGVLLAVLLVPVALLVPFLGWLAVIAALSPVWLSLPLVKSFTARHGVDQVLAAVFLTLSRGWALGLGFLHGVLKPLAPLGETMDPGPVLVTEPTSESDYVKVPTVQTTTWGRVDESRAESPTPMAEHWFFQSEESDSLEEGLKEKGNAFDATH